MTDAVLYILMRNDMASMTPGRAVAQGSHCANDAVKILSSKSYATRQDLELWEEETGNFGTVIVLSASLNEIRAVQENIHRQPVPFASCGITHDPTYPVKDGDTVHLIPVDTCMWVFGKREHIKKYVEHLELY